MKGNQAHGKSYGSLDDTCILIEANESTPLLVDRRWILDNNEDINKNDVKSKLILHDDVSTWSYASSGYSKRSDNSTKSFKSHFVELKVLAFILILLAGLCIAIYLLIIESRFPSITFSLDLVHHDVWSHKQLKMGKLLKSNNVDSVIITQTGSQNCDTSIQCLNVLHDMQGNFSKHEELPYNFLIGDDNRAYEVRGWDHESGMSGVKQKNSLVFGIIGNFDLAPPSKHILQTVRFLITESVKRRKLIKPYHVYYKHCVNCRDNEEILEEILDWITLENVLLAA